MLIYVKNIKKKKKTFYGRTDDGQPKTIVRNLTKVSDILNTMFHLKVIKNLLKIETINNIIFTKSSTDL